MMNRYFYLATITSLFMVSFVLAPANCSASVWIGGHDCKGVSSPATTWYLAEGNTAIFDEYILIQNPNSSSVTVTLTYMLPLDSSGNPQDPISQNITIGANSRETIHVNDVAGLTNTDVSTKVECTSGHNIIAERTMYWYDPSNTYWQGGHDCIGVTVPATTWYLAEGNTTIFEEYILLQNPNDTTATVTMTYMLPLDDSGNPQDPITQQITVAANSRETIHLDAVAGLESTDVSTKAQCISGQGIIAERTMYWYDPSGLYWQGGHVCIGVTAPATTWYLAEGNTTMFEEYVLLQNPNTTTATVTMTYMLPHDSSGNPQDPVTQELTVSANSRETILLNNIAELSSTDVSTKAECTSGESIIVERAMYWYDATGSYWQGGHDCIGVTAPATTWYLAEGNTNVFDEYVLVQNPNTTTATVTMTYMLPLDSEGNPQDPITHQINISPNSRETIHVNQIAGLESTDVSTKAQCTSGEGIITERSMYWSNTSLYPDPMSAYSFLRSDYYRDGTLKICPAVSASSETVDSITFILKKLDHTDDSISFNSTEYVVYSAVPDYMTISQAYQTNFDGAVSTLSTAASGLSSSPVLIANNNHESAKYYIPNFPNGTNDHTGLTENIIWSIDEYDGLPSTISTKVAQAHMVQYGWAFDPTKKIAAISWQHLAADGGSVTTAPSTILLIVTNHVLQIFTHDYIVDTITGLIGGDYPFPDPAKHWLQQGAFMCYQPGPGFQSNLLRRYTPWGAWNLLNNTSGLFVKADGTVEIPAANTSTPYPLVTQTWDENQRFCIINNLDKTVYGVNDLYPGDENYLIGNSYLPEKAGLITAWKYYPRMYYPQDTTRVDERDSDGWLGLRGDPPEYTMAWNDADNTEPGGQARKPYMMGAGIKHGSNGDQYIFRFEHSNSFLVARGPDPSSEENKLYKATIYVDQGAGAGYQSLGSITYEWQNWNVSTTGTPLWEAGSGSGYWVPQQVSLSSTITDVSVICNRASAWDSTNVITWETTTFSSQQNALGGNVYRFRVEGDTTNANMKFLVVLEDLS